jgi:hypothetical protein
MEALLTTVQRHLAFSPVATREYLICVRFGKVGSAAGVFGTPNGRI